MVATCASVTMGSRAPVGRLTVLTKWFANEMMVVVAFVGAMTVVCAWSLVTRLSGGGSLAGVAMGKIGCRIVFLVCDPWFELSYWWVV